MGNPAVDQKVDTPDEIAKAKAETDEKAKQAAEAKRIEDEEAAKLINEEADAKKREELESEGKTPEEIEEALKSGKIDQEDAPQFTQNQLNGIVLKQKEKLNSKLDKATKASEQSSADLDIANERNKLLQMALDQARANKADVVKAPDSNDFDGGTSDPEYIKQQDTYNQSIIEKKVAEHVAKSNEDNQRTQIVNEQTKELETKQTAHYEMVKEANIKDYFNNEDVSLEIFGKDIVNGIIENFEEESHLILNYFGLPANKDIADNVNQLLRTKPIKGIAEIQSIVLRHLTPKSKDKTIAPNPDEEIKGDGSPDLTANERKLEQLREQAAKTSDMKPLMDFKRKIAKG